MSCAGDGQVRLAELSATGACKATRKLALHRGPSHKITIHNSCPHSFLSCGEDAVVFHVDIRESKANRYRYKILQCYFSYKVDIQFGILGQF